MKRIAFYLSLVLVVLVLASCKKGQKNLFTPTSSGRPYEVLVVVNKPVWDRPAGRALFDVLDTNVPGLPQAERSFRISNVDPQHFDRVLKIFRNIIIVDIQDIYTQPKLKFSRDVYASPQMIMTIQAPNEDEFEEFVAKNSKVIIDFFVKAEMNRQIALLKQKHSDVISTKVGSIFDCDIWVPIELANYKEGKDFPTINNPGMAANAITLEAGEYFVLGDNRNNSEDSRYGDIGRVNKKYITGKLWFQISPKKDIGPLNN